MRRLKKYVVLLGALVCLCMIMTGCGRNSDNQNVFDQTDRNVATENNGLKNPVEEIGEGVGQAGEGVVDGVEDVVDDIADGLDSNTDDLNSNTDDLNGSMDELEGDVDLSGSDADAITGNMNP